MSKICLLLFSFLIIYSFLLEKLGLLMDFLPCVGIQKIVLQLHSGYCLVLFHLKVMNESGYLHVLPFFLLAPIFPCVTFCETELNAEMWS